MRRRALIAKIAGAAVWSSEARAQQKVRPVIGYLNNGFARAAAPRGDPVGQLLVIFRAAVGHFQEAVVGHVGARLPVVLTEQIDVIGLFFAASQNVGRPPSIGETTGAVGPARLMPAGH